MAPPESFDSLLSDGSPRQVSSLSLPEEGPPTKNLKKNFVLKKFLGNFKGFELIVFSKEKKTENRSTADPTHLYGKFQYFFFEPFPIMYTELVLREFYLANCY